MSPISDPEGDATQDMGDPSKTELTEEDQDNFSSKRGDAISAFGEGEWQKAIDLFTEAIRINANNAVVFAKRGAAFLKLKKPNACIKDCTRAIELNPDSAVAYKNRGRAYRFETLFFISIHNTKIRLNSFVSQSHFPSNWCLSLNNKDKYSG